MNKKEFLQIKKDKNLDLFEKLLLLELLVSTGSYKTARFFVDEEGLATEYNISIQKVKKSIAKLVKHNYLFSNNLNVQRVTLQKKIFKKGNLPDETKI